MDLKTGEQQRREAEYRVKSTTGRGSLFALDGGRSGQVLSRSLDELAPQTRRLLGLVDVFVALWVRPAAAMDRETGELTSGQGAKQPKLA